MEPQHTAHRTQETPRQLRHRLKRYRAHNVKFMEYFPDGTCRQLEPDDPLHLVLLSKMNFPDIQLPQVQQMMNTLRYFLFDLENSRREIVCHKGPDQTLSNMVFYRQYVGGYGVVIPVQTYNYPKFQLPSSLRQSLARTPLGDEMQLQQKFVASGDRHHLDVSKPPVALPSQTENHC